MRKKLKYILLIISFPLLIYTLAWYVSLILISREINNQLANQDINTKAIGGGEEYYIKFTKISPYGFPFKIAFKIINYQEESRSSKIECESPIYVGYDLLKQGFFGNYSGEILANYKPIPAGFGSKIISDNYFFFIKLPLNYKVLKNIFTKERDWFELVNFIESVKLSSEKIEIYDLVDNSKLYDQDYKITQITFSKRKYYTDINDFLTNIPSTLELTQKNKINYAVWDRKISPVSLLFGFNLPFFLNGENSLHINFNSPTYENLFNDIEIKFTSQNSSSYLHNGAINVLYQGKINNTNSDINFKIFSDVKLEKDFFNAFFKIIKYINNYSEYISSKEKVNILKGASPEIIVKNYLNKLQSHINNSSLKKLEDREYEIDLDVNLINSKTGLKYKIQNFSVFSGSTGIRLSNEGKFERKRGWFTKGLVSLDNYNKIIDLIILDDMLGINKYYLKASKNLYADTLKNFLKIISGHPGSLSNNISLEFEIDSANIKNGRIGTTNITKLKNLFNLTLYKIAIESIKIGENPKEKIKELFPDVNKEEENIINQLITDPTKIDNETWEKLIK